MKIKNILCCGVIGMLSALSFSQAQEAAAPAKQDQAVAPAKGSASLADAAVLLQKLYDTLVAVKDEATAKAAVPALKEIRKGIEALGEPQVDPAKDGEVIKKIQELNGKMTAEEERISKAEFFKCEEFKKILTEQ